ncbi:MAG: leucine-rich repeat protein [Clostridia bacterium]|nr:leucine-rich repeat protein [Clostridia bacterium]
MKKANKFLAIILAILMVVSITPITASAAITGTAGKNITWELDKTTGILTFSGSGEMYFYTSSNTPWDTYKNYIKEVVINEGITTIGEYAFYKLYITGVTLPDSLIRIEDFAFSYCTKLTTVTIPDGVIQIDSYAFSNCTSLTSIMLPDSLNWINNNAFAKCTSLTDVYYSGSQQDWHLIDIRAGNGNLVDANITYAEGSSYTWEFDKETGTLTFTGTGVIPDYYNEDEDYFIKRPWDEIEKDIKHLVFNEGITSIGSLAFAYCDSLETVTMSSVVTIAHAAFYDCPVLKELTTSNSLKFIGEQAFRDCKRFTYIYYSGTREEWNNVSIGEHWNDEMDKVKVYPSDYVVYSDSGTYQSVFGGNIFSWVFDAYSSTLTISGEGDLNWVFSLPWEENKYDIKRFVFSDGITGICSIVFKVHPNLEEIVIPASVTEIAEQAFQSEFLTDVYYTGTEEQWKSVIIGEDNDALLNATIHYNYVECEHNYETTIITEPTCINRGYTTHICSLCNESYVDNFVDISSCKYVSAVTQPTCTEQGYTTYTCLVCGHTYKDDYVDATGHNFDSFVIIEPTCAESGYNQRTCSSCGHVIKYGFVDALGHEYVVVSTTAPTCIEQGFTTYECTVCGDICDDNFVETAGHNYEWETLVQATCTTKGSKIGICTVCGDETTQSISSLGHNYGTHQFEYEPTCTKEGRKSKQCSRCGNQTDVIFVPATGHDYGEWTPVGELNCQEYGRKERTCSTCGEKEYMSAKGEHNYSTESIVVEATCTTAGSKTAECLDCGNTITETIPATGHSYTSEITTPATHTATGVETFTCTCGDSYTETIEIVTEHNYNTNVIAPTCTEQGHTTYYCECGDIYISDYVDATGHDYTETVTLPTCTEKGYTTYTCSNCHDSYYKEIVPATGHTPANAVEEKYVAPTCTEKGSEDVVVYCSVCNEEISRETVTLDAIGHADNDGDGYCDNCDEQLCNHRCHKTGFIGFLWKIINFFNKLFGLNKVCECGVAHY